MKRILTVLLLSHSFIILAQTPDWSWARSGGGAASEVANAVCLDVSGNVLVAGSFASAQISMAGQTVTNSGSATKDLLLAKFSAAGVLQWLRSGQGAGDDEAMAVV